MTELSDFEPVEPVEAEIELRFPVAYSHGGFAQLRLGVANLDANLLGPIHVPAELEVEPALAPTCESTVLFLRP